MTTPRLALLSSLVVLLATSPSLAQRAEGEDTPAEPAQPKLGNAFSFTSDDGSFGLRLKGLLQPAVFVEQGLEQGDEARAAFLLRRARFGAAGHLFTKDARFQLEVAYDRGFVRLNDGYLEYAFVPKWAVARAGQFKRPFAREFINSSSRLQTLDETLPTRESFADRDLGFMLHNDYTKSPGFEYAVGFFNGTGATPRFDGARFSNVPDLFHPALVARIGFNLGELDGYSEADLEGGPLRFGVASSVALDLPSEDSAGTASGELDFVLKAHGAFATGAVHVMSPPLDGDAGDTLLGLHVEGSYLFADAICPVLAYGLLAPVNVTTMQHEVTAGLAVFFFEHNLKLLTDGTLAIEQEQGALDTSATVRVAASLSF